MSRAFDDYQEKRKQKEEALLNVPDKIAEAHEAVEVLTGRLEESAAKVAGFEKKLAEANSLKSKFKDYLIGGIIGAILGVIASKLMG